MTKEQCAEKVASLVKGRVFCLDWEEWYRGDPFPAVPTYGIFTPTTSAEHRGIFVKADSWEAALDKFIDKLREAGEIS